jgi:predicted CxxxxCH...CXXCH cytochrome family protein
MAWGTLSRTGGAVPTWNGATCTNYCHGSTLAAGGAITAPTWTGGAAQANTCTACHGNPPPAPHVQNTACGSCHAGFTSTSVNLATHINGVLDVNAMTCSSCHGTASRAATTLNPQLAAAPPVGTRGETAATTRAVGAHIAHLTGTTLRSAALACTECHTVPTAQTHANGTVDVAWGTLSRTGGAVPTWNGATCTNYCHGSTLAAGGAITAPSWTGGTAQVSGCTACHGAPPPAPHSTSAACGSCHAGYTSTSVNLATHINGTVEVTAMTCTSCHGDGTRAATTLNPQLPAAPPVGTKGETATTTRAVGAHQAHLVNTRLRSAAIACSECHVVPSSTSHSTGTVDMTWGTLSRTGGAVPTWTGTTCTNYCHGSTLAAGGAITAPTWTGGAAQANTCTACHGNPPPAPHVQSSACGNCHTGYTNASVNLATHINGTLDVVAMTCTSCHGTVGRAATTLNPQLAAAPPVDPAGNTATTARGVGAHMKHLSTPTMSPAFACTECHVVPTSTSHSNGTKDIAFGTLAKTGGKAPAYNATTLGCSATYCHGNFTGGATTAVPTWTGGAMNCTSCHGNAPATGQHSRSNHVSAGCGACHSGYTSTAANASLHVNGVKNVGGTGTRITTWNATTRTCTMTCHGSQTW